MSSTWKTKSLRLYTYCFATSKAFLINDPSWSMTTKCIHSQRKGNKCRLICERSSWFRWSCWQSSYLSPHANWIVSMFLFESDQYELARSYVYNCKQKPTRQIRVVPEIDNKPKLTHQFRLLSNIQQWPHMYERGRRDHIMQQVLFFRVCRQC